MLTFSVMIFFVDKSVDVEDSNVNWTVSLHLKVSVGAVEQHNRAISIIFSYEPHNNNTGADSEFEAN